VNRDAHLWNLAFEAVTHQHALQKIDELHAALGVADSVHPKVIVEIGCGQGGTLWTWQAAFPDAAVYAVTLNRRGVHEHGSTLLEGDSRDRATLQRLKDQLGGRKVDVLFIDGDHSSAGARSDWDMYSPLVRPGGLVLVHDIACAAEPEVAPVWERIKQEASEDGLTVTEIVSRTHRPVGFGIVRMAGEQ
jgi:predicted O-methyltransferase YrrM